MPRRARNPIFPPGRRLLFDWPSIRGRKQSNRRRRGLFKCGAGAHCLLLTANALCSIKRETRPMRRPSDALAASQRGGNGEGGQSRRRVVVACYGHRRWSHAGALLTRYKQVARRERTHCRRQDKRIHAQGPLFQRSNEEKETSLGERALKERAALLSYRSLQAITKPNLGGEAGAHTSRLFYTRKKTLPHGEFMRLTR